MATPSSLKPGDQVRYSRPQSEAEAALRFDLIEVNGDRVLMRLRCNWPIPPTEAVPLHEIMIVPADGDGGRQPSP